MKAKKNTMLAVGSALIHVKLSFVIITSSDKLLKKKQVDALINGYYNHIKKLIRKDILTQSAQHEVYERKISFHQVKGRKNLLQFYKKDTMFMYASNFTTAKLEEHVVIFNETKSKYVGIIPSFTRVFRCATGIHGEVLPIPREPLKATDLEEKDDLIEEKKSIEDSMAVEEEEQEDEKATQSVEDDEVQFLRSPLASQQEPTSSPYIDVDTYEIENKKD
jgi:hypothetical protein